jgi:hypothetical protein
LGQGDLMDGERTGEGTEKGNLWNDALVRRDCSFCTLGYWINEMLDLCINMCLCVCVVIVILGLYFLPTPTLIFKTIQL